MTEQTRCVCQSLCTRVGTGFGNLPNQESSCQNLLCEIDELQNVGEVFCKKRTVYGEDTRVEPVRKSQEAQTMSVLLSRQLSSANIYSIDSETSSLQHPRENLPRSVLIVGGKCEGWEGWRRRINWEVNKRKFECCLSLKP